MYMYYGFCYQYYGLKVGVSNGCTGNAYICIRKQGQGYGTGI